MAAPGASAPEVGRADARLRAADAAAHVGRSRHGATDAATSRAARLPMLLRSALPTVVAGMPVVLDLAAVHLEPGLLSTWTVVPSLVAFVLVVAIGVVRAGRGDLVVADGRAQVRGWPTFAVADVHEVLPVAWHDHAAERRVDLALIAADGRQLALLDGARHAASGMDAVLDVLAGRVRPVASAHLGAPRRLRATHPQAVDHRDRRLAAAQWLVASIGLLTSAAASFLTLA